MAGMFYSSKEAAAKLNMTEEQLKQFVQEGKLREFRDQDTLLYKVDEVEALVSEAGGGAPDEIEELAPASPAAEFEDLQTGDESEIPELEIMDEGGGDLEEPLGIADLDLESPEVEPEKPAGPAEEAEEPEFEPALPIEPAAGTSEIFLAPETGAPVMPSDLTNADTALTGEGLSVLGEGDKDYPVTDDTMAETTEGLGATGTLPEASLEEIEGDVNLDSFGSGSGLLDLSLQADDTSLGGILDEIYTAEADDQVEPAEAGTVEDVVAEADQMMSEDDLVAPAVGPGYSALAGSRVEAAPDLSSNILGILAGVSFLIILYTLIVAVGASQGASLGIVTAVKGLIVPVVIALAVIAAGVGGAALWVGRDTSGAPKKAKAAKAKKPKKLKKGKKGKGLPAAPE